MKDTTRAPERIAATLMVSLLVMAMFGFFVAPGSTGSDPAQADQVAVDGARAENTGKALVIDSVEPVGATASHEVLLGGVGLTMMVLGAVVAVDRSRYRTFA